MCKEDLSLNNLQWFIYHKTKPNQIMYVCMYVCMYKDGLALNNPQWFIYHKTKPNQTKPTF